MWASHENLLKKQSKCHEISPSRGDYFGPSERTVTLPVEGLNFPYRKTGFKGLVQIPYQSRLRSLNLQRINLSAVK